MWVTCESSVCQVCVCVCETVVLATAVAIAVAMHMETSFVLRKAVVGMTGVVAMSQVCGWAAGRVPRLSGGPRS